MASHGDIDRQSAITLGALICDVFGLPANEITRLELVLEGGDRGSLKVHYAFSLEEDGVTKLRAKLEFYKLELLGEGQQEEDLSNAKSTGGDSGGSPPQA